MIRMFDACDLDQVMELWLNGNIEAHDFIPRNYWESNAPMVREQLLQAEIYVYETDGKILGFVWTAGRLSGRNFCGQTCAPWNFT